MPEFFYEGYTDVSVHDFLSNCDSIDITNIIDSLIDDGHIKSSQRLSKTSGSSGSNGLSAPEQIFEDALDKIHGKWNMLSKDEEEMIMALAKRF
jgi:hypothetical protein